MSKKRLTVVEEMIAVIDYLAPLHSDGRRGRRGIENGRGDPPGAWDGGKKWDETDAWIAKVIERAKAEERA